MSRHRDYGFFAQEPRQEMPRRPTQNFMRPVALVAWLLALCINAASDTSSCMQ